MTSTYEVPVTTPPTAGDNPALGGALVLDMQRLAEMPEAELLQSLRALTDSYAEWIASNQVRGESGADGLADFAAPARETMDDCRQARQRIEAGIALLASDPKEPGTSAQQRNRGQLAGEYEVAFIEFRRSKLKIAKLQVNRLKSTM